MPTLHVLQGPDRGRSFRPGDEPAVIGRRSANVSLTDHAISRRHAELRPENGHWVLEDFHSSNGTYINGRRIDGPATLKHGDQIRVGSTLIVFVTEPHARRTSNGAQDAGDLVDLDAADFQLDASILASAAANEESVILASPEVSDAVHAWNVMYQLAETIGASVSVADFLERMADIVMLHLPVDRLFVLLRHHEGEELRPEFVRYKRKRDRDSGKIVVSRRIIQRVVQSREGVLCANAQSDARFAGDSKDGSLHRLGMRSVLCVPILVHDDVIGIIHLDCNMAHHTYTQQQLLLATAIGRTAGMAIENTRLMQSRMEHERLAAVGETVAHLSHHIRNILQGMRSGADVVEIGLNRQQLDSIRTGWQIVQRNLERTYRLATNMLTFSKQRDPQIEMSQLNSVVEEAVLLVERQRADKGVTIETDLDELPAVPLDVDGMLQAVTNILINAIDAVAQQSGRITLRTRYDADSDTAVIEVEDNGPGIPTEEIERVFDAFHSTKGHRGTGLGLAAARKIVRELNGAIDVKSSPVGTMFIIQLKGRSEGADTSEETHGPAK